MTLTKGHLPWMFYLLSETTRPGYNADHHFETVTLCLQKIVTKGTDSQTQASHRCGRTSLSNPTCTLAELRIHGSKRPERNKPVILTNT